MSQAKPPSFWLSSRGLAALTLVGFAVYFLLIEHRQHLFEYLPFLILLLCPLMHLFMHRGHHHGDRQNATGAGEQASPAYRAGYEQARKDARRQDHQDHQEADDERR